MGGKNRFEYPQQWTAFADCLDHSIASLPSCG